MFFEPKEDVMTLSKYPKGWCQRDENGKVVGCWVSGQLMHCENRECAMYCLAVHRKKEV